MEQQVVTPSVPSSKDPVINEQDKTARAPVGSEPGGGEFRTILQRKRTVHVPERRLSPVVLSNTFDQLDQLEEIQVGKVMVNTTPGMGVAVSQDHG